MDQCPGWFSSSHSAAGLLILGSGLSTSRYTLATSGVTSVCILRKYAPVVSLMRRGGTQLAILPTAADRCVTALFFDGTEPWPAGPRAMISIGRGSFSVVPTLACRTLPPSRTTPPPSAKQNSALIASK